MLNSVSYHSHNWVASSKLKALGMVNTGETIPNPFDFAQGSAALEAATLPSYQIKFDRLIGRRLALFFQISHELTWGSLGLRQVYSWLKFLTG